MNLIDILSSINHIQNIKALIDTLTIEPTYSFYPKSLKPTHDPVELNLLYMHQSTGGGISIDTIQEICLSDGDYLTDKKHTIRFNFVNNTTLLTTAEYKHSKYSNCKYYKKGSGTAVYLILKDKNTEELILRVTQKTPDYPPFSKSTYDNNKTLGITQNLSDFLYYGILNVTPKGYNPGLYDFKYNYTIVRKYKVIEDLQKGSYDNRKIFFKKLIQLLITLEKHNYIINDFKPDNMGYDDDYNPIVIDYDAATINMNREGPQTFDTNKITIGTITPYSGTKQTIAGTVVFIFVLFFVNEFWAYPWAIPYQTYTGTRHHSTNPQIISNYVATLQKKSDVPDNDFKILKEMIISGDKQKGLFSLNPPTYQQLYDDFTVFLTL